MSSYSAQTIICIIIYILQVSTPLCVGLGTLHFRTSTVPSVVIHYHQNEAAHCNQISQHALHGLRCSRMKTCLDIYATERLKLIKLMQSISMGRTYRSQASGFFVMPVNSCTVYQRRISTNTWSVELVKSGLFWKSIRSRIWQWSRSCQTGVWKSFPDS